MKLKKIIRFFFSGAITCVLLYFLLSKIDFKEMINVFLKINLLLLACSFLFYFFVMALRSLRFKILLDNKLNINEISYINMFHNFVNNIIPLRLGELSYIYLIKKSKKGSYSDAISTLFISRVFDFSTLIAILLFAVIFSGNLPNKEGFEKIIPLLSFVFLVLVLFTLFIIFFSKTFARFAKLFIPFLSLFGNKKDSLEKSLMTFVERFEKYRSFNILSKTIFFSIAITACSIIFTLLLIFSIGFFLPINILIIGTIFSILSNVLPINGIAGFGTVEGIWALILIYFGYSLEMTILLSFTLHIIQLIFAAIFGFYGWIKIKKLFPADHKEI